jgi:hypothetical protein
MATTVYSFSFGLDDAAAAGQYYFSTGATTQTCVVRNMDFVAPNGDLSPIAGFRVDFATTGGAQLGALWFLGPGNCRSNRSYHWRGRATIPGGNDILVTTFETGWSWNISGYLLG